MPYGFNQNDRRLCDILTITYSKHEYSIFTGLFLCIVYRASDNKVPKTE